jgi:hypothetical protein
LRSTRVGKGKQGNEENLKRKKEGDVGENTEIWKRKNKERDDE